jgi:hypothetical protein
MVRDLGRHGHECRRRALDARPGSRPEMPRKGCWSASLPMHRMPGSPGLDAPLQKRRAETRRQPWRTASGHRRDDDEATPGGRPAILRAAAAGLRGRPWSATFSSACRASCNFPARISMSSSSKWRSTELPMRTPSSSKTSVDVDANSRVSRKLIDCRRTRFTRRSPVRSPFLARCGSACRRSPRPP